MNPPPTDEQLRKAAKNAIHLIGMEKAIKLIIDRLTAQPEANDYSVEALVARRDKLEQEVTFPPLRPGRSWHNPGNKSASFFECENGWRPLVDKERHHKGVERLQSLPPCEPTKWSVIDYLKEGTILDVECTYRTRAELPDWAKPEPVKHVSTGLDAPLVQPSPPTPSALPLTESEIEIDAKECVNWDKKSQCTVWVSRWLKYQTQARAAIALQQRVAELEESEKHYRERTKDLTIIGYEETNAKIKAENERDDYKRRCAELAGRKSPDQNRPDYLGK